MRLSNQRINGIMSLKLKLGHHSIQFISTLFSVAKFNIWAPKPEHDFPSSYSQEKIKSWQIIIIFFKKMRRRV